MKFRTDEDRIQFLIEANRPDLLNQPLTEDQIQELWQKIIKRRRHLKKRLKDRKRSQIQKANWRKYRAKYLQAIRKWHHSIDGKRFHRALGRFLALRFSREHKLSPQERYEFLKLLSSLKTHLYIEGIYYKPLFEEIQYELLIEEVLPLIFEIEQSILRSNILTTEDSKFLLDFIEAKVKFPVFDPQILIHIYKTNQTQLRDIMSGKSAVITVNNNQISVNVIQSTKSPGCGEQFKDRIELYRKPDCNLLSTLFHELSHYIQRIYNFDFHGHIDQLEAQPRVIDLLFTFGKRTQDLTRYLPQFPIEDITPDNQDTFAEAFNTIKEIAKHMIATNTPLAIDLKQIQSMDLSQLSDSQKALLALVIRYIFYSISIYQMLQSTYNELYNYLIQLKP